jgi:glycosyltransferase involved in cell wall biosynthesis
MRITHIFHSYYPVLGGMERAVQELAKEQTRMGHEVHVVTSTFGRKDISKEESANGVHVHGVKTLRFHYPDLTYPMEYPEDLLKESDIVHCHSQNSLFSVVIGERAKEFGAKVVFYFMAVDALTNHPNRLIRLIGSWYSKRNTWKAIKMADLILTKSFRDQEILKEAYGEESTYLPDGLPDYYFTIQKADPEKFRAEFDIKQDRFFLFIGRLHKLKGPQILIQALKHVDENVGAVFIGPDDGYGGKTLKLAERHGVKNRVHMLGVVDELTKIQAIDSAIALVIPSITDYVEVYPMVISEAWARGKPVIASRVGGIPYRVKDRVNGLLVEPLDAKSLGYAMSNLLKNEELARKLCEKSGKEVLSWRKIAIESLKLYGSVG